MKSKYFLTTSMLLIAANCFAQSTFEEGGLMYMEDLSDPSKMAVIVMPKKIPTSEWSMYSGNIIVPASIEHDLDTYEVVGLAPTCFMCQDLTGLDIQAPIKAIPGPCCIYGNNIKHLRLPDTLEEILPEEAIFAPNVEELNLGSNLRSISISLGNLNNLEELKIPNTIETIDCAFDCQKVKCLKLEGDKLSLISYSFSMPALEDLIISGNELSIVKSFYKTKNLKTLSLSGVKVIKESFREINVDKLILPEGITEICESFRDFYGTELSLPNSLTQMDEKSFSWAPNLKVVKFSKNLISFGRFFKGKGETLYCPWEEDVPEAPRYLDEVNTKVTFVVPKGMEAKYREVWADKLSRAKGTIIFKEEKF